MIGLCEPDFALIACVKLAQTTRAHCTIEVILAQAISAAVNASHFLHEATE